MTGARGRTTTDVLVVGGGIIGATIAWRLAQRGLKVTVLERGDADRGVATAAAAIERGDAGRGVATAAAAGMLAPALERHDDAALLALCLASRARYRDFTRELAERTGAAFDFAAFDFVECGALKVALSAADMPQLEDMFASAKRHRLSVTFCDPDDAHKLEPRLGRVLAALHFPDEGVVDPALLLAAVRKAAARAGVTWRVATCERALLSAEPAEAAACGAVAAITSDGAERARLSAGTTETAVRGVVLADGERVYAGAVVIAAGSWSALFGGGLPPASVRPIRGQILAISADPPLGCVLSGGGVYLAPRRAGRVLVGSTMEDVGFEVGVTAGALAQLRDGATRLVPGLSEAKVIDAWCGFRPATLDGRPAIGSLGARGLIVATGHHRNGILLAPITAELVTQLVMGEPPSVSLAPFDPQRLEPCPPSSPSPAATHAGA